MAMSGFICHDDYLSKTAKLTDEEVGRLFRALMRYHATGEAEEMQGRESIAFDFIREDIDRTEEAYRVKCEKNRNNRLSAIDNRQRTMTNVNDGDEKEQEKEKNKEKKKNFVPPTLQEVTEYCQERNNGVNPQRFIDFYSSKGWKVGNQSMKDWKASIRTWEQRERSPTKKVAAQEYSQRDYSGEQNEAMQRMLQQMKEGA